ncbi:MAG: type IV pilus modification protein PilV [Lautropia sp.]
MRSTRPRAQSGGFTLLEVLVAIVIVSIGMLGVAAMQLSTLKTADGSKYRSVALNLAADMADRMRANLTGSLGATSVGNGYNRPRAAYGDPSYTTPNAACRSLGCQPDEMAVDDLSTWQARISENLPGGIGIVCIDSGTTGSAPSFDGTTITSNCDGLGSMFAVKILWLDDRTERGNTTASLAGYGSLVSRVAPMF